MNDQAANRLLKTLEEPPSFTHLVLLAERREDVLATVASRCLHVRFDSLPAAVIAERIGGDERALACARLAMGDAGRARALASEEGAELRSRAERFVRCVLDDETAERPWLGLLELAKAAAAAAGARAQERVAGELELLPSKERKRYEREAGEAQRRGERRIRTRTLDEGLRLVELWLRDVLCVSEGAPELVYAVDRRERLESDAHGRGAAALRRGMELVADARLSLSANVSEELALEGLAYRLAKIYIN
jgi:DNA polymerase-3 subunit delta'